MNREKLFGNDLLNSSTFLLIMILIIRSITVFTLDCMPPMESQYAYMAEKLFSSNEKIYISFAPGYSALLFLFSKLTGSYKIASYLIYIFSSTGFCFILYKWIKEKYGNNAAIIALWLLLFLPNAAITYAGYSHCIVAALFFLTLACYRYWKLWRNETTANHLTFIFSALCAIALRPEMVLLFIFLMLCFYFLRLTNYIACLKSELSLKLILFPALLFSFMYIHKSFVQSRNINSNTTVFSDAFYSYRSFISVYCFKQGEIFTDSLSVALSTPHFGTPEQNNNSILKAMLHNPVEVLKNVTYNFTQALKLIPHPLVVPFFLFPFFGLGLFYKEKKIFTNFNLFVLSAGIISVVILFLFIVTVKYLSAITIPVVIISAYGISKLEISSVKSRIVAFLVFGFFIISASYFISFLQAGARG